MNSIIISPRRMGKTSLVKHVQSQMRDSDVKVVYMDIYKCRTEYDFYEKFAASIIQATSTKLERMIETAKEFLMGI
ncbi:MAG: ATP-binding protein, partial [Muribaculaceae bacterium]|nr:ATP-binding protein [Muribaculaceae bacterium]